MKRQTAIIGLSMVCTALAAVLLYLTFAPLTDPEPPHISLPPKRTPVLTAQAIVMPPATAFADIDAHPAFNPTRAPIATQQTANSSEAPPDVKVVGVIIDGDNKIAMIRVPSSPLATAFRLGAAVSGWRIDEIEPDRVVLTSAGLRDEIRLDANRPAKAQ